MSPQFEVLWFACLSYADPRFLPEFRKSMDRCVASSGVAELLATAAKKKLAPVVADAMRNVSVPPEWYEPFGLCDEIYRTLNEHSLQHLYVLHQRCEEAEIPLMLMKGADFHLNLYRARIPRMMHDIDVLVRVPEVPRIDEVMKSMGYQIGFPDYNNISLRPFTEAEEAEVLAHPYLVPDYIRIERAPELDPYRAMLETVLRPCGFHNFAWAGDDVYAYRIFGVHFNIDAGISMADVWHATRELPMPNGASITTMSCTMQAWLLCGRLYHEGVDGFAALRYFLDLMLLIRDFGGEIDWELFVRIAIAYETQPSAYFTLHHVRSVLGPVVPDFVSERLCADDPAVARQHNFGDILPMLLHARAFFDTPLTSSWDGGPARSTT